MILKLRRQKSTFVLASHPLSLCLMIEIPLLVLASAEVHRAAVPDLRFEAVSVAVGIKRGVHRRHQLLLSHINGHQLPSGKRTPGN